MSFARLGAMGRGMGTLGSLGGAASSGPVYSPVTLAVAPYAFYSTLRLSTYSESGPCVDLIRASDSATLTVGFVNNGLDLATIATWAAGTTAKVTKWYDQSGNGFDATQSTDASRPTIIASRRLQNLPMVHCQSQFLTLPVGLSTTQNALSSFVVGRAASGYFASGWLELGTVPYYTYGTNANNMRFNDFGSTPNFGTEVPYDLRVVSMLSSGTNVARRNEVTNSITAAGANALTGGNIGKYTPSNWTMIGDFACVAIYNSALSSGNHSSIRSALYTAYNVYSSASNGRFIAWDGDSITNGGFNQYSSYVDGAMAQLTSGGSPVQARCVNNAQTGQTLASMVTNYNSRYAGLYNASNAKNILHVFGGCNDIRASTANTGATVYSSLQSYCSAARTTGYQVVVATMLPTNGGFAGGQTHANFEIERQNFNSLVRANWATFADGLSDLASQPQMGDDANIGNTTYYLDNIHPSDYGNSLLAPIAAAAVSALL